MPLPPGWFYFLFSRQGNRHHCKITTIKQASSGSCGSWFLGAGGSQCPEAGDIQRLVAAGMPPLGFPYTAATRLIFFAARQQASPLKKQQSNMYHLEAVADGFWKLVVVSVRKVVASGCWWQWECHHYHGWVDCSHFLHTKAGQLPYAATARLIIDFLFFAAMQQMPLLPWSLQGFFKEHHCYCCWLIVLFLHLKACGLWWPG